MNQGIRTGPRKDIIRLAGWGLIVFVAALLVFPALRTSLWSGWPYLLLLLCPLMHIFMHGSHGSHGGHGDHAASANPTLHQPGRVEEEEISLPRETEATTGRED